ncbi:MAG: cell division transport system permease protein [Frankiaceae bacterium]|jgi:cell division transport system permease protein|nr:cell division transport system permease protein [Frankiaceae bacterium]MDQ1715359.1 cell division transport system permease protein [Frankiaceae bacterium]MDQ1725667.1 cell division transport system permease protein [Frankiaceae bacterium]
MRPQFFLAEIWTGFRRNATLTIAMVVNVAIALSLIGNAMLVRKQTEMIGGYFYGQLQVTIFLCGESKTPSCPAPTTDAQRQQILDQLTNMPQVAKDGVQYETQQQAYERFKRYYANQPTLLALTGPNTLPPSFRVKLKDPRDFDVLTSAFSHRPGVDAVTDFGTLLRGLTTFLNRLQLLAWGAGAAGLLAGILLVLNATLVAAHSRRRELGIMRLVGAPNYYIRLPFLVQSAIAAVMGCGLAIGALFIEKALVLSSGKGPLSISVPLVGTHEIVGIVWIMVAVSIVVSVITSWLSLIRYLRV